MEASRWAETSKKVSNMSLLDDREQQEDDDLFSSPPRPKQGSKPQANSNTQTNAKSSSNQAQKHFTNAHTSSTSGVQEDSRDTALRAELESIRRINAVIEGVTSSLEKARGNMDAITQTIQSSHTLLNTWTRILSHTEHTQRLLLNPAWSGATQDIADAENETLQRAREQARREAEEVERRAAAEERRRAEEERRAAEAERKAANAVARPASGTRGRGARGGAMGGRTTPGARATSGESATGAPARTGSAASGTRIGRGATAGYGRVGSVGTKTRGRGRGVG